MNTTEESATLAVIGAAFELPQCTDWRALTALLREGRDTLRPFPGKRAEATGVRHDDAGRAGGWIDDVTGFDHRYFGLSKAEAELIDPRQRRMLHLAVRAVGEAGYRPSELAGSDTAVLVAGYGGPHPSLSDLLPAHERRTGAARTGSLHAYAAGRIAYHLDLRGPAQVIDTSCSSFLVALHEARWKLARGESALALVGGYELVLGPVPRRTTSAEGMGVLSPTDRCRPFDSAADGTAYGEGGGFVLVKRLADALRDGDTISAVIRGSAVNQDARRSTGLTAPSPAAQTEVIAAAWKDAGVPPSTIGYIEAHGTGTKIGDPIEIQGLAQAWTAHSRGVVPVSSAKANFGHLGCMASFAGLLRVIAQFRAGEVFPTANFTEPNPLLSMERVPLRIADRREGWPTTDGPRRAAVSSFGLSGTNAHMVLEQGPVPAASAAYEPAERLVVLSARDTAALHQQVRRLRRQVAEDVAGFDLAAACEVLTAGREHFPYRCGWVVRDSTDLLDRLGTALHDPARTPAPTEGTPPPLVAVLGDVPDVRLDRLREYATAYPAFARVVSEAAERIPADDWSPAQRALLWLVAGRGSWRQPGCDRS
ncbi:polyketide synthase [Streptomyces sp. MST-110588]|uniref:polyketide synthase n=1 Tax=Streptomyces sp. MST-110588 TaxID=2833628 RepID=UPI001F5DB65A|nr:polyketide synthase [Streptomyces sp. MST-110588]UNO40117.1 hypothetical protein KGS77_11590 [Streptomyces sp. MST-110588]